MSVDFKTTIARFFQLTGQHVDPELSDLEFILMLQDGSLILKFLSALFPHNFWSIFPLSDARFHGAFIFQRLCINLGLPSEIDLDPFDIVHGKRPDLVVASIGFVLSAYNGNLFPEHAGPTSDDSLDVCSCLVCRWKKIVGVLSPSSHPWCPNRLPNAVRRLVADGVPSGVREHVWLVLSGALHLVRTRRPDYAGHFPRALVKCPHMELIDLDISRTFQSIPEWRRRKFDISTRRVLAAYALRNPSIGYCQGLSYIVGLLVTIVNEEIAFYVLCAIIEDGLLPPDYYTTLQGAMIDRKVVEQLLRQFLPDLCACLQSQIEDYSFVSIPWNMCLFSTALSMDVSVRLWDFLFAYGPCVLFKTSLGILKELEAALMSKQTSVADVRSKLMSIESSINANDVALFQSMFPDCSNHLVALLREELRNPLDECRPLSVKDAVEDSLNSCVSDDSYFGIDPGLRRSRSAKEQERERRRYAIDNLSLFLMGQPSRHR